MVVVLTILIALGSIVLPLCSEHVESAENSATSASLIAVRDALVQYAEDTQPLAFDGLTTAATESNRFSIQWLFLNPVTGSSQVSFDPSLRRGWRGPYLHLSGNVVDGNNGHQVLDGRRNELVTQFVSPGSSPRDIRIVSPGTDGVVNIPSNIATASLTPGDIGDDIYVSVRLP